MSVSSGLGEHGGTVVIEDLVADGLFGDGVHAVRVDDVPASPSGLLLTRTTSSSQLVTMSVSLTVLRDTLTTRVQQA
jgi:hypothetical protein